MNTLVQVSCSKPFAFKYSNSTSFHTTLQRHFIRLSKAAEKLWHSESSYTTMDDWWKNSSHWKN